MTRRRLIVLGAVIVVAAVTWGGLRISNSGRLTGPISALNEVQTLAWPHHFTAARWRSTPPERRWQMAADIVRHDSLGGRSGGWLATELGAPSSTLTSSHGAVVFYDVPAPQRPHDQLIVVVKAGVVTSEYLTSDPMNVPELNASEPAPLGTVPNLEGKTLQAVLGMLDSYDVSVTVTFASDEMTISKDAEVVAGTYIAAHTVLPKYKGPTMSLGDAARRGATYVVASQKPAAGDSRSGVIRLKTGPHPGSTPGVSWLSGHVAAIKVGGATQCLESCHTETECSDCHVALP